jgi:hypothetical protein
MTGPYRNEGAMPAIHGDVKHFMAACERLLSRSLREGGLTSDECDIVGFYIGELKGIAFRIQALN